MFDYYHFLVIKYFGFSKSFRMFVELWDKFKTIAKNLSLVGKKIQIDQQTQKERLVK